MTDIEPDRRTSDDAEDVANASSGRESSLAAGESPPTVGFGRTLAQERERRGWSVADMAARLRLHPRQIAALEEEQLTTLPETPFVRGFVRNYAKELQLDPAPLLADLATRMPPTTAAGHGMAVAGVAPVDVHRASVAGRSRMTVIGGAVAVLIALGLIGWLASVRTHDAAPAVASPAASNAESLAPASSPADAGGAAAVPSAAPSAQERPSPPTEGAAHTVSPPAPTTSPATPSVPPSLSAATAPAPVLNGVRLLIGDRPSWIEITQADGAVVLTGLQEPGTERRLAPVQPPLRLVIGNSSSVRLEYRGKVIDLKAHARADDLARLTLE